MGEQIAAGRTLTDILDSMVMVAEGVRTTKSAVELARRHGIEMPIAGQMELVLFEGKDPRAAIGDLMMRDPKPENAPRTG